MHVSTHRSKVIIALPFQVLLDAQSHGGGQVDLERSPDAHVLLKDHVSARRTIQIKEQDANCM